MRRRPPPGRLPEALRDARGVALPMALVTLVILTSLALAFVALARHEPSIAGNHLRSAQARAAAESGIERALWALTNATAADGVGGAGRPPNVLVTTTVSAPYDGSRFLRVGPAGGFYLTISGTGQTLRTARAVGWSPEGAGPGRRWSSRSEIVAALTRLPNVAAELGCTVCAGAPVSVAGAVTIDARGSAEGDCGAKLALASAGDVLLDPVARLFGRDAPADDPSPSLEGRDWRAGETVPALTADDVATLRALAAARGTYVRPPPATVIDLTDVPDGLVFVDTPAGSAAITAADRAMVRIRRGFARRLPFRGWIVVSGDLELQGAFGDIMGLVYAANTVRTADVTGARISGMLIAAGVLGDAPVTLAGVDVTFDCGAARGLGLLPTGWFVRPGSYCDGTGGC